MHFWLATVLIVWQLGLVCLLALDTLRASLTLNRSVALSALGPMATAILALVAITRGEALYLDIALVVAMLGVAQTLTVTRTAEKHRELQ